MKIPSGTQIGPDGQRHPVGQVPLADPPHDRSPLPRSQGGPAADPVADFEVPVENAARETVGGYDVDEVAGLNAKEAVAFIAGADDAEDERARAAVVNEVEQAREDGPRDTVIARVEKALNPT